MSVLVLIIYRDSCLDMHNLYPDDGEGYKKAACGVVPFWGACLQAVDWRLLLQKLKLTVSMVYSYPLSMPFMFSESSLALLFTFFFGALAFMLPKFHVSERFTVRPLRQFFW